MSNLFPLFLFCFSTSITPGPNNIMIMTSGLNFGIRRSLPHYLGICIGFPLMVLAVGMGFGSLFVKFPALHEIIKIIGAVYLLYLAWKIARSHSSMKSDTSKKPFSFLQAAFFQWVNPKAWIMAIGAVSAYTSNSSHMLSQVFIVTLIFLLVVLICVGCWFFLRHGIKKIT